MKYSRQKLHALAQLIRFNRPTGTLLVLWPALMALWLAAEGVPSWQNVLIFSLGALLMRSAGCAINDYADRRIDAHVRRTRHRPLVTGALKPSTALLVFSLLCLLAFALVLLTNRLTVWLSGGAVVLAACYPFIKRISSLPQVVLGAAFAWAIPMAFAAETETVAPEAWLLYTAIVLWTVSYDTFYAMIDREDDLKIGVRSTAILFGELDRVITSFLQVMVIIALLMLGNRLEMGAIYMFGVAGVASLFAYQQYLIRNRERKACFKAFLNNNYAGMLLLIAIVLDFLYPLELTAEHLSTLV